jgi:hypothetical protein
MFNVSDRLGPPGQQPPDPDEIVEQVGLEILTAWRTG